MSSGNLFNPKQAINDGRQARLETALRISAIMAEAAARLFKLQSEAANAAFEQNSKQLTMLLKTLNTTDSATLLAEWMSLYQANMRRVLDVTRSCFEIVPQTQTEIANLVGDPFASANKETQLYLDQFTKAVSDGRNAAAAAATTALATLVSSAGAGRSQNKEKVA